VVGFIAAILLAVFLSFFSNLIFNFKISDLKIESKISNLVFLFITDFIYLLCMFEIFFVKA
jgi:hypothetical protein